VFEAPAPALEVPQQLTIILCIQSPSPCVIWYTRVSDSLETMHSAPAPSCMQSICQQAMQSRLPCCLDVVYYESAVPWLLLNRSHAMCAGAGGEAQVPAAPAAAAAPVPVAAALQPAPVDDYDDLYPDDNEEEQLAYQAQWVSAAACDVSAMQQPFHCSAFYFTSSCCLPSMQLKLFDQAPVCCPWCTIS
jgi:hypothetical protein